MRKLIFSANAFSKFLLNSNGGNLREYSGYGGKGRANCFVFTSGKSACHFNTASDSFVQSRYKEINDKTIAVAQKHLSDFGVFDFMVEKQKILITDDRFHSLSVDQQQSLLSLPLSLRDIFDIEALPIAQFQDTTVRPLYFDNSGVSFVEDKIFATPQTLFDYGVYTLKKGDCVISSEAFWGTGSLQLRLLLFSKSMEADSHALKSRMVQYLIDTFKLPLRDPWNQLCLAHDNFYSDTRGVTFVKEFLEAALEFSNILFKFHEQNLLIRDDVVKWALKSKSSFHQTGKVKIKLENGEWIRLNEMYTDRECGDNVVIKF